MSPLLSILAPPAAAWRAHHRMPAGKPIGGVFTPDPHEACVVLPPEAPTPKVRTKAPAQKPWRTARRGSIGRRVLALLARGPMSTRELVAATGYDAAGLRLALRQAEARGEVVRIRPSTYREPAVWALPQEARA